MVSITISTLSTTVGLNTDATKNINKCRYKTGKCINARSSKRNGQPHQLCLYHRDKANMIQRKFDRQKRQAARSKKVCNPHGLVMSSPKAHHAVSPTSSTCSTSSSSTTSDATQLYSPDSPDCELNESVWTHLPVVATTYFYEYVDMPMFTSCNQSYLSSDEIEFLCSAILE
ncbi:hypothetical protein CCR75_004407 [Bremia lactucae]|uniref:Uncharacterized protein n=1 Tax=Bremia lactucae TaxID=4779 RepID=A0A976FRB4_BRELC|nr:hypothetical protein CCR75_004407 [Bremia lactucae]